MASSPDQDAGVDHHWDGLGIRALWYASALASRPGTKYDIDDPLIDKDSVREYATPADRRRAKTFLVIGYSWTALLLVASIVLRVGE